MPHVRGWHSRGREPPALDHDLTGLVVSSSALLCGRASEGAGLRADEVVGHFRLPPEVRSQCPSRGSMPPIVLMPLPFDVSSLRVKICFLRAISAV